LQPLWTELADADVKKSWAAVDALARSSASSVPFLKSRLHPVERTKPERILQWIADLDQDELATRQTATRELAALGVEAEPALRAALESHPSLEAKRRIEDLLKEPSSRSVPSGDLLRRLRAIHVLERIGSPEAVHVLTDLSRGAPSARETLDAQAAIEWFGRASGSDQNSGRDRQR
jgi:hypothetical protein